MKILQVINSLGTGGAEKLLLDSLPLYNQKGIEMDILLLWDNNHPFTQELIAQNICKLYILKKSNKLRDIYNPLNIFRMRKIMKHYDVVHAHIFPVQYFAVFANILNGNKSKLIFTEHNTSNNRIKNKIFKPIEKFIYSRYTYLICISKEVLDIYKNYLKGKINAILINNGVNVNTITKALPLKKNEIHPSISENDRLIMQVSAFREQKDQATLIRAMELLPDDIKLLLVGVGAKKKECELMVNNMGLTDRVFFLGQRMDIPQLLKSVDVTLLSTYYEGFGLVAVEGMASGKPFVASDVPGVREIVKDAGILFQQGDEKELAQIIKNLLEDEKYRRSVVEKCVARAKRFDVNIMIEQHIELYKKVVDNRKNRVDS